MNCHLCDLQTNQLNGLMSRHWKKHETATYSRDDYLRDVLTFNGKPPNNCPTCGKLTKYSRENASWDKYCCHACYLVTTKGELNPNYQGGLISMNCSECGVDMQRHKSQVPITKIQFCSTSCSTKYYSKPDNISDNKRRGRKAASRKMLQHWECEDFRLQRTISLQKHFQDHSSNLEKECYNIVTQLYPDAEHQRVIGYAAYDIFIPSINLAIEFDGTYWHGPMSPQYSKQDALDRRKTTYLQNNTDISLIRIPEQCWVLAKDKKQYITKVIKEPQIVYLISGPSGSGKSYVAKQLHYPVVYWDACKTSEDFVNQILHAGPLVFAEIPVFVSTHVKLLISHGLIVKLICITETVNTIRERLEGRGGSLTESTVNRIARFQKLANKAAFFGTSEEVINYLKKWRYIIE